MSKVSTFLTTNVTTAYLANMDLANDNPQNAGAFQNSIPNDPFRRENETHGEASRRLAVSAALHAYYAVAPDMAARGAMGAFVDVQDWAEKNDYPQAAGVALGVASGAGVATVGLIFDASEAFFQGVTASMTLVTAAYHGAKALIADPCDPYS